MSHPVSEGRQRERESCDARRNLARNRSKGSQTRQHAAPDSEVSGAAFFYAARVDAGKRALALVRSYAAHGAAEVP